jgi:carbonic anhydrase
MRFGPLVLTVVVGFFLQRLVGRFETLEECEKAYEELLGKSGGSVTTDPEPATTTTTTTTLEEGTTTTTLAPLKKAEVGSMEKDDAKVGYKPPKAGSGKGSNSEGWDYKEHGKDWASTVPGAEGCSGSKQSPVDITKFVDIGGQTKSVLWFDYYSDPSLSENMHFSLGNSGHGIFFASDQIDLGYVKIGMDESEAFEYVFHAPSEHTVDGQVYPLELQILHKTPSGGTLGVAILFKNGKSNDFLKGLVEAAPDVPQWHMETGATSTTISSKIAAAFNLEGVLNKGAVHPGGDLTFYNYEGSLTAPPCTEGVDWYVSADAVEATREEIKHITESVYASESTSSGNNRATQKMGSRKVLVAHTGFQHHIKHHGHKADEPPMSRGYASQDAPWHE